MSINKPLIIAAVAVVIAIPFLAGAFDKSEVAVTSPEPTAQTTPAPVTTVNTPQNAAMGTDDVAIESVKKTEHTIIIKDHKFIPETVRVPAGERIKLIIDNQDPTPEEFESHDMNREKIIGGNKSATITLSPLKAGKYHFFGEFNMDTANGYVIAE